METLTMYPGSMGGSGVLNTSPTSPVFVCIILKLPGETTFFLTKRIILFLLKGQYRHDQQGMESEC